MTGCPIATTNGGRRTLSRSTPLGLVTLRVVMVALSLSGHQQLPRLNADDPMVGLALLSPLPHQVIQRTGFDPRQAHEHSQAEMNLGYADVLIIGKHPAVAGAPDMAKTTLECRARLLANCPGLNSDWQPVVTMNHGEELRAHVRVAAGGWYRLEVRLKQGLTVIAEGAVEPFGVGELFVVAGQSYATNCNDERLSVTDPQRRVAAYDSQYHSWRIADDPQPAPDGSDGGSLWPVFGDQLSALLRVPVGLANVGVGATSSEQWLPDGMLHKQLVAVGQTLGRFRAVLWQQGESDVLAHTTTADYVVNMMQIHDAAVKSWGFEPPWLLAKSTLHPTVYHDVVGEEAIRAAMDQLWQRPEFLPGPDTDILGGENRGGPATRRHFSGIGQRRAALLWFAAVWPLFSQP
ncbi:MAG: sialate O-acetylesterase [Pirellulaceae bacterium]